MSIFKPVNDPVRPHSQITSCIQIPDFSSLVLDDQVTTIQVFYEIIAQEIYNTRKKNYSWGFGVIEPRFMNFCDQMILVSRLYREEDLADLNSVIFKLFTEFNNIIISTALNMHIPIRGIIRMGKVFEGTLRSRKPALVSGKDPLILADLLKVYSFGEIFPNGYSDGMIPAVEMPYHFGINLCNSMSEISGRDSVGLFRPGEYGQDPITEVTILSNMLAEIEVGGKRMYACNWKEWMKGQSDCSPDNVIAFAESASGDSNTPHASKWNHLLEYSASL